MDHFTNDGLTFQVADHGPNDGPPVVLLHGFPQDHTSWDQVVPLLNAAGARTLAPDLRGYSPDATPPGTANYGVRTLVSDVIALLDAASLDTVHIVGHDWGAALTWELLRTAPERFRSATILSTPHPAALAWSMTHSSQALRSWYIGAFFIPRVPEVILQNQLSRVLSRTGLPKERADYYQEMLRRPGVASASIAWYRELAYKPVRKKLQRTSPQRSDAPSDSDARRRMTAERHALSASVPVTFIRGRSDPFLGAAAATASERYGGNHFRFVELDTGHWVPETAPAEVAKEILDHVSV